MSDKTYEDRIEAMRGWMKPKDVPTVEQLQKQDAERLERHANKISEYQKYKEEMKKKDEAEAIEEEFEKAKERVDKRANETNHEFLDRIKSKVSWARMMGVCVGDYHSGGFRLTLSDFLLSGSGCHIGISPTYNIDGSVNINIENCGIEAEELRYNNYFPEMWDKPYYERLWK